jgi:hypothetical protein
MAVAGIFSSVIGIRQITALDVVVISEVDIMKIQTAWVAGLNK